MRIEKLQLLLSAILIAASAHAFGDVIGYWRFEDGSGSTASDETGVYDGELAGLWDSLDPGGGDSGTEGWSTSVFAPTVPLTGQLNNGSIRMQGGAEFIDLSNGQDMLLGSSFTIEFFMNPEQPVISSTIFGLAPFSALYFSLTESLGTLYFNSQFMGTLVYGPATGVQTGVWQHVAFVKEPSEYSVYLDGALIINDALPSLTDGPYGFPGSNTTGDRTIGGDSGTFRGYLDEFRISDTALTPDEFLIVPEPSAFLLIFFGGLSLVAARRRRNRA